WALGRPIEEERRLLLTVRTSATAIAATAPIVAWHGGGVSIAALAANWLALPWLGIAVLPAALAAAVAAAFELPGAGALIHAAGALAAATTTALAWVARELPALDRAAPAPSWWVASLVLAALGLTARATAVRAAVAAAAITPGPPRLVVLDVGQGDAALLQGRRGALLVDAGPARDDFDAG